MAHDFKTIAKGSYQLLTFPFAETVLFLGIATHVKKKVSLYKVYLCAVAIGGVILLVVLLRNILLLGSAMVGTVYFPSYVAVRVVSISDFFARVEGSIAMNFILAGVVKLTVCLVAAAKGPRRCLAFQIPADSHAAEHADGRAVRHHLRQRGPDVWIYQYLSVLCDPL